LGKISRVLSGSSSATIAALTPRCARTSSHPHPERPHWCEPLRKRVQECPPDRSCRRACRSGRQASPSPYSKASPDFANFESTPEVRALPSTGITRPRLSDSRRGRRAWRRRGRYPRLRRVSPDCPHHPSSVLCPLPRRIERLLVSITSPFTRPSPHFGRVGPAQASLALRPAGSLDRQKRLTRLRPVRLPVQAARQLPDQSTTLWAEPSSTGDTRLRGAPKRTQFRKAPPRDLCP
jgi:hypothetical protein